MNASGLVNTPGIYYALAYCLVTGMIIMNSPRKLEGKKSIAVFLIFGIILTTIMVATDGIVILFAFFMLLYVGMIFLVIYINCKYDVKTAMYFAIRSFIIGEFTASFFWQIIYYITNVLKLKRGMVLHVLMGFAVYAIIMIVLFRLERKNKDLNSKLSVNYKELAATLVIALAIFIVSNMSYLTNDSIFSSNLTEEIFYIRTLVDFAGVAILYAYHGQLGELGSRLEVEQLQNILNMQYHNYEMLEQSISAVNQKYHDLKYQISILKETTDKAENLKRLEQMEQEIRSYEAQNKTGNKVVDTILTGKALYCQKYWIELTCVVNGPALDFMDDMDISTLFGNMLDNAIESVNKIEQKEKRLIHLVVEKKKGFLRILLENCCDDVPDFKNGLPVTTKKDKYSHGFGLKSIQSTVKKYGGSVTINVENGWFELRILIPVSEVNTDISLVP